MYKHNYLTKNQILKRFSEMGDPLEKVTKHINFEIFRPTLEKTIIPQNHNPKKGGRPRYDPILMFKILLLQDWYNISDHTIQYQINDRHSFQRFLNLQTNDKVPDENTIWDFKEALAKNDTDKQLFEQFTQQLENRGIIKHEGSIVDASFVDAPRQRNTREENQQIKNGQIPQEWKNKPHKLAQKDTDVRWTKKNNETHYGYKDHINVDEKTKLITKFAVTSASVHDSQKLVDVLSVKDKKGYVDSAYVGEELHAQVALLYPELVLLLCCAKAFRNKPLTDAQRAANRLISSVRVRVEYVFGFMSVSMGGMVICCVGLVRVGAQIARRNLAYNFKRYAYLAGARLIPVI
ncbi:MAG: IS5 family transposase [Candidatus Bathyarchaeota archaeon]|nr:IS5 family transposase [Candidatus Termiticorpusculum sp.]